MQKTMKRTLALILAVMLCLSGLPYSAFATEALPDESLPSQAPPSEVPAESSQPESSAGPDVTPQPDPEVTPSPEESPEPGQSEKPSPTPETGPAPGANAESSASPEPTAATSVFETELSTVEARQVWPALQRAKARAAAGVGTAGVLQMGYYCFPIDNCHLVLRIGYVNASGLNMLNGLAVNADELNFLAKSIDRYVDSEYVQFMAAASLEKSPDLERLINLSFNINHYTVVRDVSDLTGIGKYHLINIRGSLTKDEQKTINFAQVGRDLLSSGKGVPTEYGLLFENEEVPFQQVYDGTTFPLYCYKGNEVAIVHMHYQGRTEYIIFFDWPDEYGVQDGSSDHVGIVEKVEGGRVYTIEGNSGDACERNSYPIGNYQILGYGCLCD